MRTAMLQVKIHAKPGKPCKWRRTGPADSVASTRRGHAGNGYAVLVCQVVWIGIGIVLPKVPAIRRHKVTSQIGMSCFQAVVHNADT